MMKLVLTFVCCILFVFISSAQEVELVVDTIYSKSLSRKGTYLLSNIKRCVRFKDGVVDSFPVVKSIYQDYERNKLAIWSNGYLYPVDDKLNFLEKKDSIWIGKFLPLDLHHLNWIGDDVAYTRGDSVFVNNFKTKKEEFVMKGVCSKGLNSRYLWMQKRDPYEDFIYMLDSKDVFQLPKAYSYLSAENAWLFVDFRIRPNGLDVVKVLDAELNEILSMNDGYDFYGMLNDLAIFISDRKKGLVYHKGKKLDIEHNIKWVACDPYLDWCIFRTDKKKYGVINNDGKIIFEPIFKYIDETSVFGEVLFELMHESVLQKGDKKIFKAKNAHRLERLLGGFYLKSDGYRKKIVDQEDNLIFDAGNLNFVTILEFNGILVIYGSKRNEYGVWDMEGNEISKWIKEKNDLYFGHHSVVSRINVKMFENMDNAMVKKLNPSGVWAIGEKSGADKMFNLRNLKGDKLSKPFEYLVKIDAMDHYLIKTFSGKYGIVKYKY